VEGVRVEDNKQVWWRADDSNVVTHTHCFSLEGVDGGHDKGIFYNFQVDVD